MRNYAIGICCIFLLSLAVQVGHAPASPICQGAGLPPDAPLYYLISKKRLPSKKGEWRIPKLHSGTERRPTRRQSVERVLDQEDTALYIVSLKKADDSPMSTGLPIEFFKQTNINDDGLADLLYYEPAGAFYFIALYAACGDNYYTPVAEFLARDVPEPELRSEVSGASWAEYSVIAPDPTSSHDAPLKNWARRTWKFDGTRYQQTAVEALPDAKAQFKRDDKTLLKEIHAQLEKADAAIAAQHWEGADKLIRQALAELGDRYVCPGTLDETGMKLIAADLQEREGKLDEAVRMRRKMLVARLEMLRGKTK